MRYENEDGRNKSDVGGSSESFLKAPRVTRQVYAETSIIPVTYFIASWANSGSPALRPAASLFSLCRRAPAPLRPPRSSANSLARSRLLGSPTFLFLIDSSSVLYELPLAFVTFSLCEIYDHAPKALAAIFACRNISALRHREQCEIILEISSDVTCEFPREKSLRNNNFRYSRTCDSESI